MWAIVRNITERKRAEEALQASELRYRNLFESMDEGFALCEMIYDEPEKPLDFRYLNVNPAFARLTGLGEELVVGRTVKEVIPGIEPFWIETYGRVVKSGISERIDNPVIALGKHLEVYAWRSGGGRFAVVFSDVTERKEMEKELLRSRDELEERVRERTTELEVKNTEMERFIYTVSHDLRTPLVSMSGFLGFLKQDLELGDLKRVEEDLRIANDAVTEMDRLLLETLELSRIGRVVNPPEDVPFGEIVEDALRHVRSKTESKGVKVSVAQNLPVVHVDRMRITEVLVNLMENSTKYMGLQANPEIEIGQQAEGMDRIFFVRDNGIGMNPSQHDKVFELFYKIDKKSEGSGAGLAIVKKIIEVHGGRIWIESELYEGCSVCFTLPLADYQ